MNAIKIPYNRLSSEALNGVIEEFVTRDGTDYGEKEVSTEIKINQILNQLKSGKAIIVFDQGLGSCNIFRSNDPIVKELE